MKKIVIFLLLLVAFVSLGASFAPEQITSMVIKHPSSDETTLEMTTTELPKTWSKVFVEDLNFRVRFAHADEDQMVIGGMNGKLYFSKNGTDYNRCYNVPFGTDEILLDCVRVEDTYFILSHLTGIWSCSLNFTNFQHVDDSSDLQALAYGDGQLLAVGKYVTSYSPDGGVSWNHGSLPCPVYDVTFSNGRFFFIGTSRALCYFDESVGGEVSWVPKFAPTNNAKSIVFYDDIIYAAGSTASLSMASKDAPFDVSVTFSAAPSDGSSFIYDLCKYDGCLYAVGYYSDGSGFLYTSVDDGYTWEPMEELSFGPLWTVVGFQGGVYSFGEGGYVYSYR